MDSEWESTNTDDVLGSQRVRTGGRAKNQDHVAAPNRPDVNLRDTTKYFQETLARARKEVARLTATSSRRSGMALTEMDELGPIIAGRALSASNTRGLGAASEQLKQDRVIARLCEAEKNVIVERDRYGRLLARHSDLAARQADDAKRVENLQHAVVEYEKLNITLGQQLELQGETLERVANTMKQTRVNFRSRLSSGKLFRFPVRDKSGFGDRERHDNCGAQNTEARGELAASRNQLVASIGEATRVLTAVDRRAESAGNLFEPSELDGDDPMGATQPLTRKQFT